MFTIQLLMSIYIILMSGLVGW